MLFGYSLRLTNNQKALFGEYMSGHFQIQGCGSFANATSGIVVRAVTGAIIAAEIAGIGNWDTTQMCADTNDNQPFGFLGALLKNQKDYVFFSENRQ